MVFSVQSALFYYISTGSLPKILLYVTYFFSISLPIILALKARVRINEYRLIFLLIFSFIFLESFLYLDHDLNRAFSSFIIYLGLIAAYYLSKFDLSYLENVFKFVAVVALLGLVYVLSTNPTDLTAAIRRTNTDTEPFAYGPLFWAIVPFAIISFLNHKNIVLCLLYWLGGLVLNLSFLKRFILVDTALLTVIIFFIIASRKKMFLNAVKFAALFAILIAAVIYYQGDLIVPLFDATTDRMLSGSEDLSGFDRWVESKNFLSDASIFQIVFGTGFASSHTYIGVDNPALHIGWINFIFKGGLVFLAFILTPYGRILLLMHQIKTLPLKVQFSIWYLVVELFRLFYLNMHGLDPTMIIFFYALFTIMDYSPIKKRAQIQLRRPLTHENNCSI